MPQVSEVSEFQYASALMSEQQDHRGEGQVWSAISTLVAGPAVWGFIGWLVDGWAASGRVFTAAGVVLGFIVSIYIVYVRFGRN